MQDLQTCLGPQVELLARAQVEQHNPDAPRTRLSPCRSASCLPQECSLPPTGVLLASHRAGVLLASHDAGVLRGLSPLVDYLRSLDVESAVASGPPHPALSAWVAALMAAAPTVPHAYPTGLRRCAVCGAALSTTFRMKSHLEGKRHCLAVAQQYLSGASRDAIPDASAAVAVFDQFSTRPLSACMAEPPDVALEALHSSLYFEASQSNVVARGSESGEADRQSSARRRRNEKHKVNVTLP